MYAGKTIYCRLEKAVCALAHLCLAETLTGKHSVGLGPIVIMCASGA